MAQRSINVQSMFDNIFGCCLGNRRRGESSSSATNRSLGQNDERTPLLGHSEGQRDFGGQSRQDENTKIGGKHSKQIDSSSALGGSSKVQRDTKGIVKQKKEIDLARLKSIREHAQSAFFNVESSQLLPSTTSTLHQRAGNMGASQKLTHTKRDAPTDEASYTAQQRKELIAASDKAERLYKAALKSNITRSGVEDATSRIDAEPHAEMDERGASIGLVRQIRLSVRDVVNSKSSNEKDQLVDDEKKGISDDTTQQQISNRPKFSIQTSSDSLSTDESFTQSQNQDISKMASVHSLRTLRLEPASQLSVTPLDDTDGVFSRSAHSTATTNDTDKQLSQSTDDETWERRGRTRSRRGLVWMDTTKAGNEAITKNKTKLEDIWKSEDTETGIEGLGDSTQVTIQPQSNIQQTPPDEIQYGMRFEANKAIERRKEIMEKLKGAVKQPMAETWEENSHSLTEVS